MLAATHQTNKQRRLTENATLAKLQLVTRIHRNTSSANGSNPARILAALTFIVGCEAAELQSPQKVETAWSQPQSFATPLEPQPAADSEPQDIIAVINGNPLPRQKLHAMLLEGHGAAALEQLVALTAASQICKERNLAVTQSDIDAEYDRSFQALLGDAAAHEPEKLRRNAAEALLDRVLADRNLGRLEYDVVMRRNAHLRKIVTADLKYTEEQVKGEFDRLYGERVEIRHIQLASRSDVETVTRQLESGADFGELAYRYSTNRQSGQQRGLLPVFSTADPGIPVFLRQTARSLAPGQTSPPVAVDDSFHFIRLEKKIPAANVSLDSVRNEVERSLRRRLTDTQMQELYVNLLAAAEIKINDAELRRLYLNRRPTDKVSVSP